MRFQRGLSKAAAILLAAGMALTAPAQVSAAAPTATGTELAPASVTINKHLKMPEGTTTPQGIATFVFTPVTVDGTDYVASPANMPAIPNRQVTFSPADAGAASAGVKTVSKESVNIVDGVVFPHAGEYIYTVKENASGFGLMTTADVKETMDYSENQYQVQIIVANKAGGSGTYVQSISVNNYTPQSGMTPPSVGTKVNDGDDEEGTSFAFDNKFVRTYLNDQTDPLNASDTNLRLKKTLTGAGADYTKYFDFSMTLTAPALVTTATPASYKAVIVDSDGSVVTTPATNNGVAGDGSGVITVTPSSALSFKLKHNQTLVILDAPVGTKYSASETGAAGYTTKMKQTINGAAGADQEVTNVGDTLIGEASNRLDVTNNKADITPTGVVLTNLPYVVLGAFAAGVFLFLLVKSRRRRV